MSLLLTYNEDIEPFAVTFSTPGYFIFPFHPLLHSTPVADICSAFFPQPGCILLALPGFYFKIINHVSLSLYFFGELLVTTRAHTNRMTDGAVSVADRRAPDV